MQDKSAFDYGQLAEKYRPPKIRVLFITESPPSDFQRHFYHEKVQKHDSLFLNMMRVCFPHESRNQSVKQMRTLKAQYLEKFKRKGFFLIDASETSIAGRQKRDKLPLLELEKNVIVQRLQKLGASESLIVLITKTVWEVYNHFLRSKGFIVAHDFPILYPGLGHQQGFRTALTAVFDKHSILENLA